MGLNKTAIQWTWRWDPATKTLVPMSGSTWNPLVGCERISPGCGGARGVGGCYAERLIATRLSQHPTYKGLAVMNSHGPHFTGEHRIIADRLDAPLRAKRGRKIFVNDLGDLFFRGHHVEEIAAVIGVIAAAHWQTFQVLTKRADRMRELLSTLTPEQCAQAMSKYLPGNYPRAWYAAAKAAAWPLPNMWVGVSTEDQKRAEERIPHLVKTPAVVHFLSIEPQLSAVYIGPWAHGIDWVVQGGESGPGARAFDIRWMDDMRRQCAESDIAWFPKQFGAHPYDSMDANQAFSLNDAHGGTEEEWPERLRGLRTFPTPKRWPR